MANQDQIATIMESLLNLAKFAPEAKQTALKVLIEQMNQLAEQMKETRELEHFQKLQTMMVEHWVKIKQLCQDDPEMLARLEAWKQQFVNNKKAMLELVKGQKDQITDKTQELQQLWNNMYTDIGILKGICYRFMTGNFAFTQFNIVIEWGETGYDESKAHLSLRNYIAVCNSITTGNNLIDAGLPEFEISSFIARFNMARSEMIKWAWNRETYRDEQRNEEQVIPIEKYPEIKEILLGLETKLNNLSQLIRDITKLFSGIKVIRDTKMLESY